MSTDFLSQFCHQFGIALTLLPHKIKFLLLIAKETKIKTTEVKKSAWKIPNHRSTLTPLRPKKNQRASTRYPLNCQPQFRYNIFLKTTNNGQLENTQQGCSLTIGNLQSKHNILLLSETCNAHTPHDSHYCWLLSDCLTDASLESCLTVSDCWDINRVKGEHSHVSNIIH